MARLSTKKIALALLQPLLFPFDLIACARANRQDTVSALIIRLDALGDIYLWLPCLRVTVDLLQQAGFKRIVLVATPAGIAAVRPYCPQLEFIAFDSKRFLSNLKFRVQLIWKVRAVHAALTVAPAHTRDFVRTDYLVWAAGSKRRVAPKGDSAATPPFILSLTDQIYTRLLESDYAYPSWRFEGSRNESFVSLLCAYLGMENPPLFLSPRVRDQALEKTVLFAIGGTDARRRWPVMRFVQLAKRFVNRFSDVHVVLIGSEADVSKSEFDQLTGLSGRVTSLVGKTSLQQYQELLGQAALVLSNETSAMHICAMYSTPCVSIVGGGHFGRFAPYPEKMTSVSKSIYAWMPCYGCNWHCRFSARAHPTYPCISSIDDEMVFQEVVDAYASDVVKRT